MSAFTLTTETERAAGFHRADQIRELMDDINREDIPGLCIERSDHEDSVYSYLGRALEVIFRQLGLSNSEAMSARMHTCDTDAQAAYNYVIKERPCETCQGYGEIEIFHPSTDALIGSTPCTACPPF